jgi:hypothetical protein
MGEVVKMVAKAEGKTAANANKRVAARIIKMGNESVVRESGREPRRQLGRNEDERRKNNEERDDER